MSGRDLLYSFFGHILFGFAILFLAPVSAGMWGEGKPPPLIFPVGIVEAPPGTRPAVRSRPSAPRIPKPAADDLPVLQPMEKLEKEKLAEKPAPDSVQAAVEEPPPADTAKTLAMADTDPPGKTGEISHTIFDGAQAGGEDDLFGEYVPAVGYGATDPYFQSLFLAIRRAFRNPVPGYKTVRCVVTFTIMNTGEVKNIKLETSSGLARFDRAAVGVIQRMEWGRPFPEKFKDYDGYHIRMPFEYVPQ